MTGYFCLILIDCSREVDLKKYVKGGIIVALWEGHLLNGWYRWIN